ncbi:hypothetical protein K1719_007018 [Acacia pycnantha]|nr:hypothetical protein K1719_007018 [Acacia pycnantha]
MALPFSPLLLHFLFVFHLSCFLAFAFTDQADESSEKNHLLSFKTSLHNPHLLASWNSSTPYCNWVGVTCELDQVTSLFLLTLHLEGPLPSSLLSLTGLTVLNLFSNALSGDIPPQIANLRNLRQFNLSIISFPAKFQTSSGVEDLERLVGVKKKGREQ